MYFGSDMNKGTEVVVVVVVLVVLVEVVVTIVASIMVVLMGDNWAKKLSGAQE